MGDVVCFDVYGRFRVRLVPDDDGNWFRAFRVGNDGKGRLLADLVIPVDAGDDEVRRIIEAVYHEIARPGSTIERIVSDG